jgi:hypothetical protein
LADEVDVGELVVGAVAFWLFVGAVFGVLAEGGVFDVLTVVHGVFTFLFLNPRYMAVHLRQSGCCLLPL